MKKFITFLVTFILLFSTYAYAAYERPTTLSISYDLKSIDNSMNVSESIHLGHELTSGKIVKRIKKVNNSTISITRFVGYIRNNSKIENANFYRDSHSPNNYTLKETEDFYEISMSCDSYSNLIGFDINYSLPLAINVYNDGLFFENTLYDNSQNDIQVDEAQIFSSCYKSNYSNNLQGVWVKNLVPTKNNSLSNSITNYFKLDKNSKLESLIGYTINSHNSKTISNYPIKTNENKLSTLNSSYGKNLISKELLDSPNNTLKNKDNLNSNKTNSTDNTPNMSLKEFIFFILSKLVHAIVILIIIVSVFVTLIRASKKSKNRNKSSSTTKPLYNSNNRLSNNSNQDNTENKIAQKNETTTYINNDSLIKFPSDINPAFLGILMKCSPETLSLIIFLDLIMKGFINIKANPEFNPVLNGNTISEYIISTTNSDYNLMNYEVEFLRKLADLEALGTVYLCDLKSLKTNNFFSNIEASCKYDYNHFLSENLYNLETEELYINKWTDFSNTLTSFTKNNLLNFSLTDLEKLNIYSFALGVNVTSTYIETILPDEVKKLSNYFGFILSPLNEYNQTLNYRSILDYSAYIFKY